MNFFDWLMGRLEESVSLESEYYPPEKPKRKNDESQSEGPSKFDAWRHAGEYAVIVKVPTYSFTPYIEADQPIYPMVYQGDVLYVRRINRAGLYEAPYYDPSRLEVIAINCSGVYWRYRSPLHIEIAAVTEPIERLPLSELLGA